MKVSELRALLVSCPDDAEVFMDFPDGPVERLAIHFDIEDSWLDTFSMSILNIQTSGGGNNKVVTIIPGEIVRC